MNNAIKERKLLTCDRCGHQDERMNRLSSTFGRERQICQGCYDRNPRKYCKHSIGIITAWQEFGEMGGW